MKGDASSERVRGCSAELPELRRGGGEGEGQGRRPWRCPRRGAAPGDLGAAGAAGGTGPEYGAARAGVAAPHSAPALPGRTGPFLSDSGEPVMNDRTSELLV